MFEPGEETVLVEGRCKSTVLVVLLVLGALVALVVDLRSDDDAQVHDVDVQHVNEGQPGRRCYIAQRGFHHAAPKMTKNPPF